MHNNLQTRGYQVLRGLIPQNEVEFARSCIRGKTINYKNIEEFIDKGMMSRINEKMGERLICTKYRVSNNNNSTDAAAFHRDLQSHTENEFVPIYTCLSYLDPSAMGLVPGSHIKSVMSYPETIIYYINQEKIEMNPGDVLVFQASLIHKGLFYRQSENRRLIQLFDCIPEQHYQELAPKILHQPCMLQCYSSLAAVFKLMSKFRSLIGFFDIILFLNVALGYGAWFKYLYWVGYGDYKYIASEANQDRHQPKYDGSFEESNLYIVKEHTTDLKEHILITRFMSHWLMNIIHFGLPIAIILYKTGLGVKILKKLNKLLKI